MEARNGCWNLGTDTEKSVRKLCVTPTQGVTAEEFMENLKQEHYLFKKRTNRPNKSSTAFYCKTATREKKLKISTNTSKFEKGFTLKVLGSGSYCKGKFTSLLKDSYEGLSQKLILNNLYA